ncbi:Phage_Mu_F domain-containing protein [Gammaproteobacteria bacterium]
MPKDTFNYPQKKIDELIEGIYTGSIIPYDIPEDLYFAVADYLKSGLYKGFGGSLVDFTGKDLELLTELRENIYMFSAAKNFQQLQQIQSLMFDEKGERVSMEEFSKLGEATFERWNSDWGRSEYNTAVHSAQMASKWQEIERTKDVLPNLTYSTIGDACDICAPLEGFTAPVNDSAWSSIYPTNHFSCLCVVLQEDNEKELTSKTDKKEILDSVESKMQPMFKMNSGKDRIIFSTEHPYFKVDKKDSEFAKTNFGLPLPESD